MNKLHLPGLNGIRAIACLMVFKSHFDASLGKIYAFRSSEIDLGHYGVTAFFTLSGFLITTLLLREKAASNSINIKRFYIRRVMRIWPLYYLIILIGAIFFIKYRTPTEHPSYFLAYIFLAGNVAFATGKAIWSIGPLWSVSVEEQFYLIWPFLIKSRHILQNILLLTLAFLLLKAAARFSITSLYVFLSSSRIECMTIGGVLAFANHKKLSLLRPLSSKFIQVASWLFIGTLMMTPFHISTFFDQDIYALAIGIIIFNVSSNPNTILTLENKVLNYLGTISYGIYSWHMLIFYFWSIYAPHIQLLRIPYLSWFLPFLILSLVVLIAHLSYYYYEKRFLLLKDRPVRRKGLSQFNHDVTIPALKQGLK